MTPAITMWIDLYNGLKTVIACYGVGHLIRQDFLWVWLDRNDSIHPITWWWKAV